MPEYEIREKPDGTFEYVEVADESAAQARAGAGEVPPPSQPNIGGWQRSRDPVTGEDVLFNPTTREIERRPGTPPPQRGGLQRLPTGQYLSGGKLLRQGPDRFGPGTEVYDPTTGETGGRYYEPGQFAFEPTAATGGDWRVQGGYLVNQRTGQIMDVSRPSARPAGRTVTPGEEEQNLAAAANQRAQAAYNQARADGYQEEQARQIANDEWQREYQRGQLEIQQGNLGLQTRLGEGRLGLEERQLAQRGALDERRLGLEERQTGLQERIGLQRLGLDERQLAVLIANQQGQRELGQQRFGLDERLGIGRLGIEDRQQIQQAQAAAADRALRQQIAGGELPEGRPTLEAELGRRGMSLQEARLAQERDIANRRVGLEEAGLYGVGPGGETLQNVFGRAGLLGELEGRPTIAGRQMNLTEDEAAFRRLSTPSAVGNLAALQRRGLVPASSLQTGQVSGIFGRTGRFGGVSGMGGGVTAPPNEGRMFAGGSPTFNESTGQYNRISTFGGGQAPLQYSLQSLKGLSPRDTQTLAGYTGAMGRDFGDIQNQAVNEMADLGEGLQRRRGYRLGG